MFHFFAFRHLIQCAEGVKNALLPNFAAKVQQKMHIRKKYSEKIFVGKMNLSISCLFAPFYIVQHFFEYIFGSVK